LYSPAIETSTSLSGTPVPNTAVVDKRGNMASSISEYFTFTAGPPPK